MSPWRLFLLKSLYYDKESHCCQMTISQRKRQHRDKCIHCQYVRLTSRSQISSLIAGSRLIQWGLDLTIFCKKFNEKLAAFRNMEKLMRAWSNIIRVIWVQSSRHNRIEYSHFSHWWSRAFDSFPWFATRVTPPDFQPVSAEGEFRLLYITLRAETAIYI